MPNRLAWTLSTMASSILVLSGCDPSISCGDCKSTPPNLDDLALIGYDIRNEIALEDLTDPRTLPTSGSAEYDGVISLTAPGVFAGHDQIQSGMTLNVDFAGADPVTGSADGFFAAGDQEPDLPFAGTLNISDGVLNRSADPAVSPVFSAFIEGTLADELGGGYRIDGVIDGVFTGASYDHTYGQVTGGVIQTTTGGGGSALSGDFVARR